jgi:hypothetical protein
LNLLGARHSICERNINAGISLKAFRQVAAGRLLELLARNVQIQGGGFSVQGKPGSFLANDHFLNLQAVVERRVNLPCRTQSAQDSDT